MQVRNAVFHCQLFPLLLAIQGADFAGVKQWPCSSLLYEHACMITMSGIYIDYITQ